MEHTDDINNSNNGEYTVIKLTPDQVLYLNTISDDLQTLLDKITWTSLYQWYPEIIDKCPEFHPNIITVKYKNNVEN